MITMSRLTALRAAVLAPPITRGADEEEASAASASNLPETVHHDSPGERAGKLPTGAGAWETGRTSACARSPEGPGRNPGPSSSRRAACARSLPPPLALANFPAAHPRPGRHDERGKNLRIREAINTRWGARARAGWAAPCPSRRAGDRGRPAGGRRASAPRPADSAAPSSSSHRAARGPQRRGLDALEQDTQLTLAHRHARGMHAQDPARRGNLPGTSPGTDRHVAPRLRHNVDFHEPESVRARRTSTEPPLPPRKRAALDPPRCRERVAVEPAPLPVGHHPRPLGRAATPARTVLRSHAHARNAPSSATSGRGSGEHVRAPSSRGRAGACR